MLIAIDHIVVVVPDLQAAVARYEQLGFSVVTGGRHTTTGTHNALIGLADDSYIELLAFYQPNPRSPWWGALEHGGGLSDFCVLTDDLQADVAALRQSGVPMSDPTSMGRVRPDGYQLEWMLSRPSDALRGVVPFLIEDVTPRDQRLPSERAHANTALGLDGLTLVVEDGQAVCKRYGDMLHEGGTAIERHELGGGGRSFKLGAHRLDVVTPTRPGFLSEWLARRGPSVSTATLRSASGSLVLDSCGITHRPGSLGDE